MNYLVRSLYLLVFLFLTATSLALQGCSGGDVGGSSTNPTPTTYTLSLQVSQNTINSDDVDSATITATVTQGSVGQPGVGVAFSPTNGRLDHAYATTDAEGKATAKLYSGAKAANQTVRIFVKAGNDDAGIKSIPLQITGNTLTLSVPQTNMVAGTEQFLTSILRNGVPLGIADTTVTYNIVSGSDVVSLANTTVTTDPTGLAKVKVTAIKNGTAVIEASGMGATAQITLVVASEGGSTITVVTSKTSIVTNDSDSALITATAIKDSIVQAGVNITFSATGGALTSSTGTTGADGKATVSITSGPKTSNQLININATSATATSSVPLMITGNTLALTLPQTNMAVGTELLLTATLQNAIPTAIPGAIITYTLDAGADIISLSSTTGTTDSSGKNTITIKADKGIGGTATINAAGMGVNTKISVTVSTQAFEIIAPTTDPATLKTTDTSGLLVTVRAPDPLTKTVVFHTTLGSWNHNEAAVDPATRTASARLTSTMETGTANVTVYDKRNPATKDSLSVNVYAPASQADSVTLKATQYNIALTPENSESKNSLTLTAEVENTQHFRVGDAVVYFSLSNLTGGGEHLSSSMARTNSAGVATCTFYSGSLASSGEGVKITATVAKSGKNNSVNITVTGQASSIDLGRSTKIIVSPDNTYYKQTITAIVNDANGNLVPNAVISLNLWPKDYYLGSYAFDKSGNCVGYYYNSWPLCSGNTAQPNEDLNRNFKLDADEDTGPYNFKKMTMWPDGYLTPAQSTVGFVPATVITGDSSSDHVGTASFDITYLKKDALWIGAELTASAIVQGTETQAKTYWILRGEKGEVDNCDLEPSQYGYYYESCPGDIEVTVIDKTDLTPIAGATVAADDGSSCVTGGDGSCTIAAVQAGSHMITISAPTYQSSTSKVDVLYNDTVKVTIKLSK